MRIGHSTFAITKQSAGVVIGGEGLAEFVDPQKAVAQATREEHQSMTRAESLPLGFIL